MPRQGRAHESGNHNNADRGHSADALADLDEQNQLDSRCRDEENYETTRYAISMGGTITIVPSITRSAHVTEGAVRWGALLTISLSLVIAARRWRR
jgi:hypothetical protein